MLLPNLPIIPTIFIFLKFDLINFYGNDLPIVLSHIYRSLPLLLVHNGGTHGWIFILTGKYIYMT